MQANEITTARRRSWSAAFGIAMAGWCAAGASAQEKVDAGFSKGRNAATLEETRLTMDKWIETQQILSKERKDWAQSREILAARIDVVKRELATLTEKTKTAETTVTEAGKKRADLERESAQLEATATLLGDAVTAMEAEVRKTFQRLPEPVQTKLQPLFQRIPDDTKKTRVSIAERFQNVLGILGEIHKASSDITVGYEVHELANGKPAEVKVLYVGLSQAYYVSARGEAGIGRPTANGWKWEPANAIADQVVTALEIIQGKQSPAFVPLPVKLP